MIKMLVPMKIVDSSRQKTGIFQNLIKRLQKSFTIKCHLKYHKSLSNMKSKIIINNGLN